MGLCSISCFSSDRREMKERSGDRKSVQVVIDNKGLLRPKGTA